jgi:hypothetical protein
MAIVGALIWIVGIRFDLLFTVMYLSWNTSDPRQHHMEVAEGVIRYLITTRELPLILGGALLIMMYGQSDASIGTATKAQSVLGWYYNLGKGAGAVVARVKKTDHMVSSSFEGELDGSVHLDNELKTGHNILQELEIKESEIAKMVTDNSAAAEFMEGRGVAPKSRHMQRRAWKLREDYIISNYEILLKEGDKLCADVLTKPNDEENHWKRVTELMGLHLLEIYDHKGVMEFLKPRDEEHLMALSNAGNV